MRAEPAMATRPRPAASGRISAAARGLAAALLVALTACAPREADVAISERAAAAPSPKLIPTEAFGAPMASATADIPRRQAETDALAARAEALRGRGEAMSDAAVIAPATVDRLTDAVAP
jgi:hypothetical protein